MAAAPELGMTMPRPESPPPAPGARPGQDIANLASRIAHLYLEVERGLRPPTHLRRIMSPQAYGAQQRPEASRVMYGRPVTSADIGSVMITRASDNRVHAAVVARHGGDRWGAVVMELGRVRGRWIVTELTRAQDRNLVRHAVARKADAHDIEAKLRAALADRRLVRGALGAATGDARAVWSAQARALDEEIADLVIQSQARRRGDTYPAAFDGPASAHVTRLVGTPPAGEQQRSWWTEAAVAISEYRRRWELTDDVEGLGPRPTTPEKKRHWQDTMAVVGEALYRLGPETTRERPADYSRSHREESSGAELQLGW